MAFSFLLLRSGSQNPDFRISGGRIVLSVREDAARDRIFTRLSINRTEWYLDQEIGIPYLGESAILGGKKSEAEVSAIIRREILMVDEVGRINSLEIAQDALRHVAVTGEVILEMPDGSSETSTFEV